MLEFSKITIHNARQLKPYLDVQPFRSCDYTLGAVYQWRAYFRSAFAIVSDMLVMLATYPGEGVCFVFPVGNGDLDAALDAIEAHAKESGMPLRFCAVPKVGLALLCERYGARAIVSTNRDWADYVYNASDLMNFPGKKYHTQRNHLNRFCKDNPSAKFVPVTEETLPVAIAFLDEYEQHVPLDKVIEAEEMKRAKELLADSLTLGQKAGYIDVAGTVVALSVGEIVGDTLHCHVEKARVDYAGSYQAIVSWYAKYAAEKSTHYINREDDSGEERLRYSKMAYRPICMIDKYWVDIE
ncbi:MAG TPA: hypothetical protein DCY10_04360 [Clostridiales bacterium]|jgi:hypothetical protein|nr:hypothetical protein [Clostridiales bacterium]